MAGLLFLPTGGGTIQLSPSFLRGPPPARRSRLSAAYGSQLASSASVKPEDWVELTDAEFFRHDSRPIMLFDGVCNLCNGGVRFVRANDRNRRMRFEALQSESGRKLLRRSGRSPDDISSVVLVDKDRSYIKSEAVVKIMEYLDLPFPQLALLLKMLPLFLRDFAYDNIANNRYAMFGRSESSKDCHDRRPSCVSHVVVVKTQTSNGEYAELLHEGVKIKITLLSVPAHPTT